jgi:hypothetical protein
MAKPREVLEMLIPNSLWIINGEEYEGITFVEGPTITKEEYEAGFAQYDSWKAEQDAAKAAEKAAILNRLGITADEAKLLLS